MKKEIKELTECSTLEELFETWQAKQVEEVNKLSEAIHNSPEKICVSEIFIKRTLQEKREHDLITILYNFSTKIIVKIVAKIRTS